MNDQQTEIKEESTEQKCSCQIQDIGIITSVGHVFATIIFDKKCPFHGHIGRDYA